MHWCFWPLCHPLSDLEVIASAQLLLAAIQKGACFSLLVFTCEKQALPLLSYFLLKRERGLHSDQHGTAQWAARISTVLDHATEGCLLLPLLKKRERGSSGMDSCFFQCESSTTSFLHLEKSGGQASACSKGGHNSLNWPSQLPSGHKCAL